MTNGLDPITEFSLQVASKEFEGFLTPLKQWIYATFTYKQEIAYYKRKKDVARIVDSYEPEIDESMIKPIFDVESLKKFIQEIVTEAQSVKRENLILPDKTLVGTIVNSSQYFIDDDVVRKQYARLLVATIDSSKSNLVHKSFAKTLEELSPLEIQIMDKIFSQNFLVYCDTIRVYNLSFKDKPDTNILEKSKKIVVPIEPVIFFKDDSNIVNDLSFLDLSTSLSILQKTNLVKPTVLAAFSLDNVNLSFNQQDINRLAKKYIKSPKRQAKILLDRHYNLSKKQYSFAIEPNLNYFELTNYGKSLCKILYPEKKFNLMLENTEC